MFAYAIVTTSFFVWNFPWMPPTSGYIGIEPTKNRTPVSSTRSQGNRCTLERKFLEPRRTSGHQRFVNGPLLNRRRNPNTVFRKGLEQFVELAPPSRPGSARVTGCLNCHPQVRL